MSFRKGHVPRHNLSIFRLSERGKGGKGEKKDWRLTPSGCKSEGRRTRGGGGGRRKLKWLACRVFSYISGRGGKETKKKGGASQSDQPNSNSFFDIGGGGEREGN